MYNTQRYDLIIIWCIILCFITTLNIMFKELIFKERCPQFLAPVIAIPINLLLIGALIHAKLYKKSNIKSYLIIKNILMIGSIYLGQKPEGEFTAGHYQEFSVQIIWNIIVVFVVVQNLIITNKLFEGISLKKIVFNIITVSLLFGAIYYMFLILLNYEVSYLFIFFSLFIIGNIWMVLYI